MNELVSLIKNEVLKKIDIKSEVSDEKLLFHIDEEIHIYSQSNYISINKRRELRKEIFNAVRGLDILEDMLADDSITEIMINGYQNLFIEREGIIEKYNKHFESKEKLEDIIQQIASKSNRIVNETTPILDTRLFDGSRVNIVLNPIAINGPIVTIRKFYKQKFSIDDLMDKGALNEEIAHYLEAAVINRKNIFISGGTGTGKTTFLNALSDYIPKNERIITIEDSAELKIMGVSNLVSLETRNKNIEGENEIKIRDLLKSSLRMRPDRIIVGEVRGEETIDLLQCLNSGHSGSISTGHSNSAKDMLSRLETMFLMGMDMALIAIRMQIASAIDIIIHLTRTREGKRRIDEIVEVTGFEKDQIIIKTIFKYDTALKSFICLDKNSKEDKISNDENA